MESLPPDRTIKSYGAWLLLLITFNFLLPFVSSAKPNGVCISPGGRFPPFTNQGKPPRKVDKGPNDLTLCRVFRKKTCCDVVQTHPAFLFIRRLASTGEASEECLQLWELLECSICHPNVGVLPGPPLICASFCDRIYQACSNAYFSIDAKIQALAPCGVNDFVCGRASEWISNGTDLCKAAGFAVTPSDDFQGTSCYGGQASLDSISDSWSSSKPAVPKKKEKKAKAGIFKDFRRWARRRPINEKVSWAVGGMVLTAGLLFVSKRKSHNQRHKQAAVQRSAKKLGGKGSPKYPASQANRGSARY